MYTCSKYVGRNPCKTSCDVKCGKCGERLCKDHEFRCNTCDEPKCQGCNHRKNLECKAAFKKRAIQVKADKIRLQFENLDSKIYKITTEIDQLKSKFDKITELFEAIVYAPNGIKYNEALKDFEERQEKSE
jgi:hypothetical protein